MHLFKPEIGLMGTSGIVGPSILLAAGAAYTFKLVGSDRVSVAYFGDGAVNNGAFHEGCNMATVWELPVLLVCENNLYATEVPFATVDQGAERRQEGGGLRAAARRGRRQRRARGAQGSRSGDRAGTIRRRPDPAGVPDLPAPVARGGDAGDRLPYPRRGRGVEDQRPDPGVAGLPDR